MIGDLKKFIKKQAKKAKGMVLKHNAYQFNENK